VVLFPSDFTRLVEELFHTKLESDRATDLVEERRVLSGKATPGDPRGGEDESDDEDPKVAAGKEKIQVRRDCPLRPNLRQERGWNRVEGLWRYIPVVRLLLHLAEARSWFFPSETSAERSMRYVR
jgi:hypothetical protein